MSLTPARFSFFNSVFFIRLSVNLNHETAFTTKYYINTIDQGHLYPLGERRDKHVTGGARTSALLHRRRTHYLKSYLDSL